ncbi:MAG: NADH-quinone oxidoreductase subunit J [Alphaproteobacteria bacterium]|nr:NADH-quinone oxidoreductase subunit J [Alphaproteobacteria bacterium]
MITAIAFYFFSAVLLLSALCVITARNPVHSVLFLILAFFNAAGLFVLLGAEFIAMILVIVYVGAVAVLFLFVVMMLDISFADLRKGAMQYVPLGILIGGLMLAELVTLYMAWPAKPPVEALPMANVTNTVHLGQVLYTDYVLPFQVSGLVLLVAMIGAIVLTFRQREGVRRQKIAQQVSRKQADVISIEKIPTGKGIG